MSDAEASFDLIDTPKEKKKIPLNDRNILSLLKSPLNSDVKTKNPTRMIKKSYGLLENKKENVSLEDSKNVIPPFINNQRVTRARKRYISDISVYTDLNTESLINNTGNASLNNTFLKKLSNKILNTNQQTDDPKIILNLIETKPANKDTKRKKASDLLVLGQQWDISVAKKCNTKTERFNKHLQVTKKGAFKFDKVYDDREYKPSFRVTPRYPQGMKQFHERVLSFNGVCLMKESLMRRIGQYGNQFDITLNETLDNMYKR